jgi:RNA-directed DNA polymerase
MSSKELGPWLKARWPGIRSRLDAGTYRSQPVRRVMIAKRSGGERMLGVPAAVDRLICEALSQLLTPIFDPHFHPCGFGYRPRRSRHHAVEQAGQFVNDEAVWCADLDLESFFDRVQQEALMARVARGVQDTRVLRLVRRYLEAGVMEGGLVHASEEATPQGSPLSPLLGNVMLDDLDWELERRGHRFVRDADEVRVHVASERAGQRVLESITRYVERRLKLKVSRQKSAVDLAKKRRLLGFRFFGRDREVRVRIDPSARKRAKLPRSTRNSTSGSAGDCDRCAGRNGSVPKRGDATCVRSRSPSRRPMNGPTRGSVTGASRAPLHCSAPCPTPTGPTKA